MKRNNMELLRATYLDDGTYHDKFGTHRSVGTGEIVAHPQTHDLQDGGEMTAEEIKVNEQIAALVNAMCVCGHARGVHAIPAYGEFCTSEAGSPDACQCDKYRPTLSPGDAAEDTHKKCTHCDEEADTYCENCGCPLCSDHDSGEFEDVDICKDGEACEQRLIAAARPTLSPGDAEPRNKGHKSWAEIKAGRAEPLTGTPLRWAVVRSVWPDALIAQWSNGRLDGGWFYVSAGGKAINGCEGSAYVTEDEAVDAAALRVLAEDKYRFYTADGRVYWLRDAAGSIEKRSHTDFETLRLAQEDAMRDHLKRTALAAQSTAAPLGETRESPIKTLARLLEEADAQPIICGIPMPTNKHREQAAKWWGDVLPENRERAATLAYARMCASDEYLRDVSDEGKRDLRSQPAAMPTAPAVATEREAEPQAFSGELPPLDVTDEERERAECLSEEGWLAQYAACSPIELVAVRYCRERQLRTALQERDEARRMAVAVVADEQALSVQLQQRAESAEQENANLKATLRRLQSRWQKAADFAARKEVTAKSEHWSGNKDALLDCINGLDADAALEGK